MSVRTREATEADLPFLLEADRHLTRHVQSQVVAQGRVIVAENDLGLIGLLRWGLFWDEIPFLNLLRVLPEHRGQGIGTAPIASWETAQRRDGHELVLTSTMSNEEAQHLYRRLGYVDTGALVLPDEATEIILRKGLA